MQSPIRGTLRVPNPQSEIPDAVTLSEVLHRIRDAGIIETMPDLKKRVTSKSTLRDVQMLFGPGVIQRRTMCWHVRAQDVQRILNDYGVDPSTP